MSKVYFVESIHNGRSTIFGGTMEELVNDVFGYTLECGNSWNPKINRHPTTVRGLVSALNKSAVECRRYNDCYEVAERPVGATAPVYGHVYKNAI